MKQLTNNPAKGSRARGVILLCLIIGCYAPSGKLIPTLRKFIDDGPPGFRPYMNLLLRRTLHNGPRSEPPCSLELNAAKRKMLMRIVVATDLMVPERQATARCDAMAACRCSHQRQSSRGSARWKHARA